MSWIHKNRREFLILLLIILVASFFRFYQLDQYMQFLGDQGRDALVIKAMLVDNPHHFPALGPPSSVGTVYLGPLYYYMMASAMAIFWMNPAAAAGMCALLGVLSVGLIYYLTREWFGKIAAVVAATFYAFSPVAINYSRFSWNPNPVPFFTLLAFLGLYKSHRSGNFLWFILSGLALAGAIQMHYLALILLPIFGVLWLYELILVWRHKLKRNNFWWGTLGAVGIFLLTMSPLVFFDIRHGFLNYHGLVNLFFGNNSGVKLTLTDSMNRIPAVYANSLNGRYLAGENGLLTLLISLLILVPLIWGWQQKIAGVKLRWPILATTIWLVVGFVGLMFYKGDIYDHYLAFVSPVPFILMGALFQLTWEKLKNRQEWGKWVFYGTFGVLFVGILLAEFSENPLFLPPNRQLQNTQFVAKLVIQSANKTPYNFALLSKDNYDSAYQFYLEQYGDPPQKLPFIKTDQLFVVCEDQHCQPVGNPKYEIAAFGWTLQDWEKDVDGVKIYRLVPNPAQGTR